MRSDASSRRDAVERLADIVSSPVLNVLVGIASVVMPVIVLVSHRMAAADIILVLETILLLALVISHLWLRQTYNSDRDPAGHHH